MLGEHLQKTANQKDALAYPLKAEERLTKWKYALSFVLQSMESMAFLKKVKISWYVKSINSLS